MSDFQTIFLPFLILFGTIIICIVLEALDLDYRIFAPVTIIGGLFSLYSVILGIDSGITYVFGNSTDLFGLSGITGLFVIDNFSRFFAIIFLIVLLFVSTSSIDYMNSERNVGIYYILLVFATIGMLLVAAANDLIALFVAWELGSLPVYALAAFQKTRPETSESALKLFLIGAMSSAFILFGISLVYGITCSMVPTLSPPYNEYSPTNLRVVVLAFSNVNSYTPLHLLALIFLVVGFGYKMAAVPFHAWAVDVYQGTPTTITTFLAAGSKALGFVAVFRIIVAGLTEIDTIWGYLFAFLAILTMTLGNVVALVQENIKRMLAYSSIAHAGYILIALAAVTSSPISSVIGNLDFSVAEFSIAAAEMHILTHALMKIVAFTAVIVIAFSIHSEKIEDYAGLRKKHPWVTFGLTIALLSLLGIPPLGGFVSKVLLFFAAIYANLIWLAIIGIINSAISIFYYIRVIKLMIVDTPIEDRDDVTVIPVERVTPFSIPLSYQLSIFISVLLIIVIGILPAPFLELALSAARNILPP
ncbi:MAG: NADH-quinone oxidoreductase subunit N [Candidatus Heimdallarchaeota archaeon]|nr:MAG: NADH-quinone oxidoreductase subunit N [Candidatus Heimdallarchaeota archaeon]